MKVLYLLTRTMKLGRRTFLATCLCHKVYRRQRNDLDEVTPSREEQTTKDSNLLADRHRESSSECAQGTATPSRPLELATTRG